MKWLLLFVFVLPSALLAQLSLEPAPKKKEKLKIKQLRSYELMKPIEVDRNKLAEILSGKTLVKKTAAKKKEIKLSGKVHRCSKFAKLPRIVEGCEGEACGMLRYNKAIRSTKVFAEPKSESLVLGEIKKCDLIEGFQSYLVVKQHGKAVVLKPTNEMAELGIGSGDVVPIVQSLSEGYFSSCVGEKEFLVNMGSSVDVQEQPITDSWVKIKVPSGAMGFAREDSRFYMGYYDYDPGAFCPGDKEA